MGSGQQISFLINKIVVKVDNQGRILISHYSNNYLIKNQAGHTIGKSGITGPAAIIVLAAKHVR